MQQKVFKSFVDSEAFGAMMLEVGKQDIKNKKNTEWLLRHPAKALIFSEIDSIKSDLTATYNADFNSMVYVHYLTTNLYLKP